MIENKRYAEELITCQPISWKGLTLYPISIHRKFEFDRVKGVLAIMQQALSIEFASMPYLKMLHALELSGGGCLGALGELLCMALHVDGDAIQIATKGDELDALIIDGVRIDDSAFVLLRSLIAEQNLIKLPNEAHNMELVAAREEMAAMLAGDDLETDFEHELYFVAQHAGLPVSEVYHMSIRAFYKHLEAAIARIRNDQCAHAEAAGGTYKGGNPYPHPVYPRKDNASHLVTEAEMSARKAGMT